jgi:glycosyltransferase involved in cell wall biosynthesis
MAGSGQPATTQPRRLIIVPAHNEASTIGWLTQQLCTRLTGFDVLVVDDASTDGTAERCHRGVILLQLPFNLGIGGAMQTGYQYAARHGYEVAVQVDGDGQHRVSDVPALTEPVETGEADMTIGSRFISDLPHNQQPARRLGGVMLSRLIRTLTGNTVTDCTSGLRAANRCVIEAFADWYPEDYPEPEVTLLLLRGRFTVKELPVRMRQRQGGESSIDLAGGLFYVTKVSTSMLLDLFRHPWANKEAVS